MAKLIVNPTSASRREILLPRSVLSIGRDPSNDLVLPDAMVSRRHAVVEFRGSQYFLRDCNSSNGSLVNGDRVSERSLRDGDLVAIGTARLLFRDDLEIEDTSAKVVQHPSAPRLNCPSCSADYRKGDLYCRQCGTALAPAAPAKIVCTACGTAVPLPARFCNACGRALPAEGAARPPLPQAPLPPTTPPASAGGAQAAAAAEPASEPSPEPSRAEPLDEVDIREIEAEPAPKWQPQPAPASEPERTEEAPLPFPDPKGLAPEPQRPAPILSSPLWQQRPERDEQPASTQPAGLAQRFLAGLIDALIVGFMQALVLGPALWYWWRREAPSDPADVPFLPILFSLAALPVAVGLVAAYFVHGWGVVGATPGKRWLGLAVEGSDGSYPIGVSRALMRLLGYVASGAMLGVGFLMIALAGSGFHDKLAGTRVVRRGPD